MKTCFYSLWAIIFVILLPCISTAQSSITFQVNMRAQIEEGTFIPSQHKIAIRGDQVPFSKMRTIKMHDEAPKDSVYTAKVHFSSIVNEKELNYNFLILKNSKKVEEQSSRSLFLGKEDRKLPAVSFNQFAR